MGLAKISRDFGNLKSNINQYPANVELIFEQYPRVLHSSPKTISRFYALPDLSDSSDYSEFAGITDRPFRRYLTAVEAMAKAKKKVASFSREEADR
jgi:hypothetical protein